MVDAVALAGYLVAGAVAGLVAAVAMDLPMGRQPDGWTPAFVAAAVLSRTAPADVSFGRASLVHHGAGVAAGALYGLVTFALTGAVPPISWAGVSLLAHSIGVVLVTLFIYGLFAHVVLPRVGGTVYEERSTAVRGQWLRSSLVFAAAVTIAGPPLIALALGALEAV
jgi:hypothetical protein